MPRADAQGCRGNRGGPPCDGRGRAEQIHRDRRSVVEADGAAVDWPGARADARDGGGQSHRLAEYVAAGGSRAHAGVRTGLRHRVIGDRVEAAGIVGRAGIDGLNHQAGGAQRQVERRDRGDAITHRDRAGAQEIGRKRRAEIEVDRPLVDRIVARADAGHSRGQGDRLAEQVAAGGGRNQRGPRAGLADGVRKRARAAGVIEAVAGVDRRDRMARSDVENRGRTACHAAGNGRDGKQIRGDGRAVVEADGAAVGDAAPQAAGGDRGGKGGQLAEDGAAGGRCRDQGSRARRADDIAGGKLAGAAVEVESVAGVDSNNRVASDRQGGGHDVGRAVRDSAGGAEQRAGADEPVIEVDGPAVDRRRAGARRRHRRGQDDRFAKDIAARRRRADGGVGVDDAYRIIGQRVHAAGKIRVHRVGVDRRDRQTETDRQGGRNKGGHAVADGGRHADLIGRDRRAVVEGERADVHCRQARGIRHDVGRQGYRLAEDITAGRSGADRRRRAGGGDVVARRAAAGDVAPQAVRVDGGDREAAGTHRQGGGDQGSRGVADRRRRAEQIRGDGRPVVETDDAFVYRDHAQAKAHDRRGQCHRLIEDGAASRHGGDRGLRVCRSHRVARQRPRAGGEAGRGGGIVVDGRDRQAGAQSQPGGYDRRRTGADRAGDAQQIGRNRRAVVEADRAAADGGRARAGCHDGGGQRDGFAEDVAAGRVRADDRHRVGARDGVAAGGPAAAGEVGVSRVGRGDCVRADRQVRRGECRRAAGDRAGPEQVAGDRRAVVEVDGLAVRGDAGAGAEGRERRGEGRRLPEHRGGGRSADCDLRVRLGDGEAGQGAGAAGEVGVAGEDRVDGVDAGAQLAEGEGRRAARQRRGADDIRGHGSAVIEGHQVAVGRHAHARGLHGDGGRERHRFPEHGTRQVRGHGGARQRLPDHERTQRGDARCEFRIAGVDRVDRVGPHRQRRVVQRRRPAKHRLRQPDLIGGRDRTVVERHGTARRAEPSNHRRDGGREGDRLAPDGAGRRRRQRRRRDPLVDRERQRAGARHVTGVAEVSDRDRVRS